MKTSKKVLSLLLIAAMFVSMLCMGVSATTTYEEVSISEGEPVKITWNGTTGTVVNVDPNSSYIPKQFILWVRNGFTVSVGETQLTPNSTPTAEDTDVAYTINTDATNAITITATNTTTTYTINCPHYTAMATGVNPVDVNGYLPVGQFARPNSFGWGTLYTDNTNVKSDSNDVKFKTGYVSTGVSLGSFGGYVVMDFGEPAKDATGKVTGGIFNDAANAYGVDFTLYGNAMGTWAEPGCVQVSQDGSTWYTLAGSLHYQTPTYTVAADETVTDEDGNVLPGYKTVTVSKSGAIWNYSVTYENPVPDDDSLATGESGTTGKNVVYSYTGLSENGKGRVLFNNWHRHNYFPLLNNYFVGVNGHTALDGIVNTISPLVLRNKYAAYTPKASSTVGAKLTMSGVRLMPASNSTAPDTFLFGYADCHPNGTLSTVQVNPYTTGRTGNDNSNGDPMDLSWAVDDNGKPVTLDSVRYVRVYTGVMQMNGMMGESSTEVLGSHRATLKGDGESSCDIEITASGSSSAFTLNENDFTEVAAGAYRIVSDADHVFVNGVEVNGETGTDYTVNISAGGMIQIIAQTGTESPFLTVLKCR